MDDAFDDELLAELPPTLPFMCELFEWLDDELKKSDGGGNICCCCCWLDWDCVVDSKVNVLIGGNALFEMLFKRGDGDCMDAKNGSRVKKSLKSPPNDAEKIK